MAGPYKCTNMQLIITVGVTEYTLGVVQGLDIVLGYEGGPESKYGSRTKSHSAGSKIVTFTVNQWFYADAGQEDLLIDLFHGELTFTLKGQLIDNNGVLISNTSTTLTGCRLYRWRPRTGGPDDTIGEEASGSGTDWTHNIAASA